MQNFLHVEGDM